MIDEDSGEVKGVVVFSRDITKLRRRKKELKENRENLKTTLNSIGDAVIATDEKGNIIVMNPVDEELTGYEFQEVKGVPLKEVFNIVNAKTRKKVKNPVREVIENGKKVV